jgi:integrase
MKKDTLYLGKRGGVWRIGYSVDSKLHWKSTGKRHKAEALAVLRDFKETLSQPKPLPNRILSSFKAEILEHLRQCFAPGTVELYNTALTFLVNIIGDINIKDITARHADTYKTARLQSNRRYSNSEKIQATTVNSELRTLRAAFNTALKWNLISSNPFKGVQLSLIPEKAPVFFGREDFIKLTEAISEEWLKSVVIFAALTGMRRAEIINMRREHIDLQRKVIYLESTSSFKVKAGRRRVIPLSESACFLLTRLPETNRTGFVFENDGKQLDGDYMTHLFKRYVRQQFSDASVLHFHSLRHTTASWLVASGSSLFEVQTLLGHSTSKTTQIYAHLLPENLHCTVNRIQIKIG